MSNAIKRRDFIKTASMLGTTIPLANAVAANDWLAGNDDTIKNNYFTVSFDRANGMINIYRSNGILLLTGGTAGINLFAEKADSNNGKHLIASGSYKHTLNLQKCFC